MTSLRIKPIITFLFVTFFCVLVKGQGHYISNPDNKQKIEDLILNIELKHDHLKENYIPTLRQVLNQFYREDVSNNLKKEYEIKIINHLNKIVSSSSHKISADFEEQLVNWVVPLLKAESGDKAILEVLLMNSLPDAYYPMRVLLDKEIIKRPLQIMANNFPKELMTCLRYYVYPKAEMIEELEMAAKQAPAEAKQYLHYQNNIRNLLVRSEDDTIQVLFDIFQKYRYGSDAYYLLDKIVSNEIDIDAAEALTQDEDVFLNTLTSIAVEDSSLGLFSVREKIADLSNKYILRLRYQYYQSKEKLEVENFHLLSDTSKIWLLLENYNLLKKRDLTNYFNLISKVNDGKLISEKTLKVFNKKEFDKLLYRIHKDKIKNDLYRVLSSPAIVYLEKEIDVIDSDPEEKLPFKPEYVIEPYTFNLSDKEKELIKYKSDYNLALENLEGLLNTSFSEELLSSLMIKDPISIIKKLELVKSQSYSKKLFADLSLAAPLTVKNYVINKSHPLNQFLYNIDDSRVKALYNIDDELGNWTRAYLLLDQILKEDITIKEADKKTKNKSLLVAALINIMSSKKPFGRYSVEEELSHAGLSFVRNFNISENNDGKYVSELKKLDAKVIYSFIVYGEEEIISSTYKKMLNEMMRKLPQNSLWNLLQSVGENKISSFFRMAFFYKTQNKLFSKLSKSSQTEVLNLLFKNLEQKADDHFEEIVNAAEIIIHLNDEERIEQIHQVIQNEFERSFNSKKDRGVAIYALLGSLLSYKVQNGWAKYVAQVYKLPNINSIDGFELFNDELKNIQRYFFYNDADGRASFSNFKRHYERSSYDWEIKERESYVKVISKTGKKVEIYANKPAFEIQGQQAIEKHFQSRGLAPHIVVHRGLSTHTLKTFRRVPNSVKLILDGSCGGFYHQYVALQRAPDAQILCNRNIGTMHINDPLFKQVSDDIRLGKNIEWQNFWKRIEGRLGSNPYFKDYIPPHRNIGAIIQKVYYELLEIH